MQIKGFVVLVYLLGTTICTPQPNIIRDISDVIDSVFPLPSLGLADTMKDLMSINVVRDLPQLLYPKAAQKLKVATNIPHGSPSDVRANSQLAFISLCPAFKVLGIECVCSRRFKETRVIKNKENNAYATVTVEPSKRRVVVSYRYSVSYQNWLTDLDYEKVQLKGAAPGIKVHRGFHKHYHSMSTPTRALVLSLLKNNDHANYTLHITGYSLGAAVATISVPDWANLLEKNKLTNKIQVYTYSGPRPGNLAFANYIASLNIPVNRYTYQDDVVPHLPMRIFDYVHAGVEFHDQFDLKTKRYSLQVCSQEYDEDPRCALGTHKPYSAISHMMPFGLFTPLPPFC